MTTILVTGGAGYIGSHVARQLGERGEKLVTLDNLSTGFRGAVLHGGFVQGDTGDAALVARVLAEHKVDTVMHFAAHIQVPESVANPLKYYRNNTANTRTLLECCVAAGVKQFVFSSTAAVYGMPAGGVAEESTPTVPINPYGWSKLMSEQMLRDVAAVTPLRYVALRVLQRRRRRSRRPHRPVDARGDSPHQGRLRARGRPAPGHRDLRHRLRHAGRHLHSRLHPRRGPRRGPPAGARLPACRRRIDDRSTAAMAAGSASARCSPRSRAYRDRELTVTETGRRAGDPPQLVAAARRIRDTLRWTPRYEDLRRDRGDRTGVGKAPAAPTHGLTVNIGT